MIPEHVPSYGILRGSKPADRIPQEVYEEVLRPSRDTPDRFWLLCSTILFHALSQIETHPDQTGVEISLARCMPPQQDGKIRSLREYAGRGTFPWRGDLHTKDSFLGVEALASRQYQRRVPVFEYTPTR
jgi:hypothetical protein